MKESYDVVVIGSGFGGAVTGCRLAQAGRSVCILERGRRWAKTGFPRSTGEVARSFWRKPSSLGFFDYRVFRRIDVMQGAGVGGGSLIYFNVHIRTPALIFAKKQWPASITREVMDPYYDLVKVMLDAVPLVPPAGRDLPARTKAFIAAVEGAGRKAELLDIAVYTGPDRENPHGGVAHSPCDYSGMCLLGCHRHAKNTLDLNYIPLAERKHGAEVYPLHLVDRIEPVGDNGYRVHFERLDEHLSGRSEPGHVSGKKVILAAGTLGTTEILLRCRDVHKTLPHLGSMLGNRFSGNGDMILAGTMNANREVDAGRGPHIAAGADFSTENNRIFIEDLGFPDSFLWFFDGAIPTGRRVKNLFIGLKTYIQATLRIGGGSGKSSFEMERFIAGGATTRFLPYLGMGTDAGNGVMRLKQGWIDIDWSHRESAQMFSEMEQAFRELTRAVNGKYVGSIIWRWPLRKRLTAHPVGGCVMGDDKTAGVVNELGEVWGYPGLYVADGSIVPTALSVNPAMTISALAERIAFWIIHGHEMKADDRDTPDNA
jgi:cholesterol oxidase